MRLNSLLLGSAAVLVAATGARAADAIVVEPEPVEYVRICDAYGAGWFYIPGTETCIKFDGDVRVQYGFTEYHTDPADETSQHEFNYRARLNVRANNETEYGTLSSRIRFVGEGSAGVGTADCGTGNSGHKDLTSCVEGPGSAGVVVDTAWISLAGFRLGFDDNYWSTAGNYGYYEARFDGPYGFGNGIFFDYTWAGNGWSATIGLEDGFASGEAGAPDVYGGITYSGSGWYLAGIYYHDSSADAGAWKFRADYDFGTNGFAVGGWYMSDDGDTDYVKGHAWGVTAKMSLAENMLLFAGYGDYDDQYTCAGTPAEINAAHCVPEAAGVENDFAEYTVGIAWNIVPGLLIQPEWTSRWYEQDTVPVGAPGGSAAAGNANYGRFSLRVVRSF
jgi:hypothetical protein